MGTDLTLIAFYTLLGLLICILGLVYPKKKMGAAASFLGGVFLLIITGIIGQDPDIIVAYRSTGTPILATLTPLQIVAYGFMAITFMLLGAIKSRSKK